ncbi:permease [Rhizobiaceae bacterium]|nr:permease [Rhizobiaceae bacterium]
MTASTTFFVRHEMRLMGRDVVARVTGGKPARLMAACGFGALMVAGLHWGAAWLLAAMPVNALTHPSAPIVLTGALAMLFALMFSQAIESVTRAYYARADLDLVLSSPAPAQRLFRIRSCTIVVQVSGLAVLTAGPALNVMAWQEGAHWLAGYGVLLCLAALATAGAIGVTLGLFRTVGPARTRLMAQIVAAVVGAGFVIALQAFGIMAGQGISRLGAFLTPEALAFAPAASSMLWWPARALSGEIWPLIALVSATLLVAGAVIEWSAARFAKDARSTVGQRESDSGSAAFAGFRATGGRMAALRRKEWALLARDPWLVAQTLQQLFYMLPAALLLYLNHGEGAGALGIAVPVLVMAAGQLAGGLGWIAVSGEDAADLISTAPVPPREVLTAKVQAVLAVVTVVIAPFAAGFALVDPTAALFLIAGVVGAGACAVTIQLWFRRQMDRSLFRRRQVSSKVATVCEALVSILWAAAAGVALWRIEIAAVPLVLAAVVMLVARFARPERDASLR